MGVDRQASWWLKWPRSSGEMRRAAPHREGPIKVERPHPFVILIAAVVALAAVIGLLRDGDAPMTAKAPAPVVEKPAEVQALLEGLAPDDGPVEVIFGPAVTGGNAVIVSDADWLREQGPALWYDNNDRLGDSLGHVATAIMGVPPTLHIATVIQNGQTIRRHDCLSRRCAVALENGLARLPRPLPGVPVIEGVRSFFRHSDYLAAHGAALADPQIRFAFPGDKTPAAPESGLRTVVIVLPSEIVATPPRQGHVPPPPQALQWLTNWVDALIQGTGAALSSVDLVEAAPLWVFHTDRFLNSGSGTFSLPNLSARHVTLRIEAPQADLDLLQTRFDATRPPEADLSVTHDAIRELFVERGLSTDCLPACGTVDGGRWARRAEMSLVPNPVWTLRLWRITDGSAP